MTEILLINPGKKKKKRKPPKTVGRKRKAYAKKTTKNKGSSMAKRRRRRTTIVRRNPTKMRRNPSKRKAVARRTIAGINPKKAITDAVKGQPGMLMAEFFAKKFGKDGKSIFDSNWSWENFAWSIGGAFAAGLAGNMIKPGSGNKMVEHGLGLVLNKLIQDKMIQQNATLKAALGQASSVTNRYAQNQYLNPAAATSMRQYDMYGNRIVPNSNINSASMAGQITPANTLGGMVVPEGVLGNVIDMYAPAFRRRA